MAAISRKEMVMKAKMVSRIASVFACALVLAAGAPAQKVAEGPASAAAVPKSCTVTTTYVKGIQDNYALPIEQTTYSPALAALMATLHPIQFDEDLANHQLGQSFQLCSCEVCSAKLEIGVRITKTRDIFANDGITVGV